MVDLVGPASRFGNISDIFQPDLPAPAWEVNSQFPQFLVIGAGAALQFDYQVITPLAFQYLGDDFTLHGGFAATFRLVFLSFLHSNFLKRKINPKEFDRVLRVSFGGDVLKVKSLDQKLFRDLREIFHGGFDLDPMFTGLTSSFCMRLLGIKTPLQNLFEFDFMARFETNKPHLDLMNAFADLIEKGKWE